MTKIKNIISIKFEDEYIDKRNIFLKRKQDIDMEIIGIMEGVLN